MSEQVLARCRDLGRSYGRDGTTSAALRDVSCEVTAGARIAISGPSGSGKSTLLHLIAGLDVPTSGELTWPAIGERSALRPGAVALVFQGPSLLPPLNVIENVALPLLLRHWTPASAVHTARSALDLLGLLELEDKLPEEISGGQAQRVAIARALAGQPVLILADEPTSQLDRASGERVVSVLLAAAEASGAALVVATHDETVAARMRTRWMVADGVVRTDVEMPAC